MEEGSCAEINKLGRLGIGSLFSILAKNEVAVFLMSQDLFGLNCFGQFYEMVFDSIIVSILTFIIVLELE